MRVHYLQHVPFEGLAAIATYMDANGHEVSRSRLYCNESLPPLQGLDWLIIMGGPMSIHDGEEFPWLIEEKRFIREAIESGKLVLGICLGAQLIADALGAEVYYSGHREIGWFPVSRAPEAATTWLGRAFPEQAEVFHWHGDTFDIPEGAVRLAESTACANQGFLYGNRALALQFHLETTPLSASALIENCGNELDNTRFVQSEQEILAEPARFEALNTILFDLLTTLESQGAGQ
jgi:GMP synthase-like glutamine amidotransferase